MISTSQAWPRHGALWARVLVDLDPTDIAHDAEHVLRVYRAALWLAPHAQADPDLCGAAALVHDLVQVPKESSDRPLASERSAQASLRPLADADYDDDEIEIIAESVRTCSWSRGLAPTHPVGVVLQDADRLDAIGALGVMRNIATAQAMATRGAGSRFYDPADPPGHDRPLDDRRNALDHARIKLLRLAQGIHLPAARAEAERRHAFLERFLAEVWRELGQD